MKKNKIKLGQQTRNYISYANNVSKN